MQNLTDWNDYLAIGGILLVGLALIALGWERTPILYRPKRRERGLKGLIGGLNDRLAVHLTAQVGGDFPAGFTPQRLVGVILLAMTVTILMLLWMGFGGISLLFAAGAGYAAATGYAGWAMKKRRKRLDAQIMNLTEIQMDVLHGGQADALQLLADVVPLQGNPLQHEIGGLVQLTASQVPISQAITEIQGNVTADSSFLLQYLTILREIYRPTEESGGMPPERQGQMVESFYALASDEEDLDRDVEILASPGRTTKWMVVGIIAGIFIFQFFMQRDTMQYFVRTTIGQVSLVIVFFLVMAVIVVGERFTKVE